MFTGKVFFVGPGGYELKLSPGSEAYDLHDSEMGHLMMPCSKGGVWEKKTEQSTSFTVGDFFQSARASSHCSPATAGVSTEFYDLAADDDDDDWEEPANFWTRKRAFNGASS